MVPSGNFMFLGRFEMKQNSECEEVHRLIQREAQSRKVKKCQKRKTKKSRNNS
jgi:hypothetical protein